MTKDKLLQFWEGKIVRTSAIVVAIAALVPISVAIWPSPLNAEFQVLVGESLENTIERIQQRKRFLEREVINAVTTEKKSYWLNEKEKVERKLEDLWKRKFKR